MSAANPVPLATGDIAPSPTAAPPRDGSLDGTGSVNEKGKHLRDGGDADAYVEEISDERREAMRQLAAMTPEEYAAFEKKTLWKMDLNIIPWIT